MDDPIIPKLVEHMNGVEQYGEVEATRYMRMVTSVLETRNNNDMIRRLPTNMTKSGCYREYGKANKYKLTRATGCGFKATWMHATLPEPNKNEPGSIVSWFKYLSFW